MMSRLCCHPNVGGTLLVSLGCESFNRNGLAQRIKECGRPAETLVIQKQGGTLSTVEKGQAWLRSTLTELAKTTTRTPMCVDELIVGAICGGSDATSGITANPAIGRCFDLLVDHNASAIFEEGGELIGCEQIMADQAVTPELAAEIFSTMEKTAQYYSTMGHGSFAVGNADGGLTTVEEKSMGAYAKSGSSPIRGLIKPGDLAPSGGLYLMDIVPDGEARFGFPNINDTAEIAEMMASGAHLTLFSTGRGSVVGSAISPVIKVCANPETYRRMAGDMDVDAGRIIEGQATLDEVGQELFAQVLAVAGGAPTKSESLGHQEFVLTYKSFEPIGPACLPV